MKLKYTALVCSRLTIICDYESIFFISLYAETLQKSICIRRKVRICLVYHLSRGILNTAEYRMSVLMVEIRIRLLHVDIVF